MMKIPTKLLPFLTSTLPLAPRTLSVTVYHPAGPATLRQVSVPAEATTPQEEEAIRSMLGTAEPWLSAEYTARLLGPRTLTHA